MKNRSIIIATATTLIASSAGADLIAAHVNSYQTQVTDYNGSMVDLYVQDLYIMSDDAADTLLNVYDVVLPEAARINYYQSVGGTGWLPANLGGPFDTDAVRRGDSFVTIGGVAQGVARPEQAVGAGDGVILDPSFGGNDAMYPGDGNIYPDVIGGGWANSNPPSLAGSVGDTVFGLGVFIGRFSSTSDFTLEGSTLSMTWNQGLGTPGRQTELTVTPAPGALALLGLAGIAGRRRRD
jgi:hypothetical protein